MRAMDDERESEARARWYYSVAPNTLIRPWFFVSMIGCTLFPINLIITTLLHSVIAILKDEVEEVMKMQYYLQYVSIF